MHIYLQNIILTLGTTAPISIQCKTSNFDLKKKGVYTALNNGQIILGVVFSLFLLGLSEKK